MAEKIRPKATIQKDRRARLRIGRMIGDSALWYSMTRRYADTKWHRCPAVPRCAGSSCPNVFEPPTAAYKVVGIRPAPSVQGSAG